MSISCRCSSCCLLGAWQIEPKEGKPRRCQRHTSRYDRLIQVMYRQKILDVSRIGGKSLPLVWWCVPQKIIGLGYPPSTRRRSFNLSHPPGNGHGMLVSSRPISHHSLAWWYTQKTRFFPRALNPQCGLVPLTNIKSPQRPDPAVCRIAGRPVQWDGLRGETDSGEQCRGLDTGDS